MQNHFKRWMDAGKTVRPSPMLRGHVDAFKEGRFIGWACDVRDPEAEIKVHLCFNGEVVRSAKADILRPDVNDIGVPGRHGFDFFTAPLPVVGLGEMSIVAEHRGSYSILPLGGCERDVMEFFAARDHDAIAPSSWGNVAIIENIGTRIYQDAIYIPMKPGILIDRDRAWGLYDRNGDLIDNAAYRRGLDLRLVGQSRTCAADLDRLPVCPFETMVYGGPFLHHYGHFLLSSLGRLWAIDGSHPVLFHSASPISSDEPAHIGQLLAASGLHGRSFSFDRPTRIKRIVVPQPALLEQHGVAPEYSLALAAVGRSTGPSNIEVPKKIYLSKSKLSFGVTGLENEDYIDQKMASAGFAVVHPEAMSVADQVNLFRSADMVVGMAGSAFHTLALTPRAEVRRIVFTYNNFLNSNFLLIDQFSSGVSDYFSLASDLHKGKNTRFNETFRARNINHLAEKIISIAEKRIQ